MSLLGYGLKYIHILAIRQVGGGLSRALTCGMQTAHNKDLIL
jgi:hypothetical protein